MENENLYFLKPGIYNQFIKSDDQFLNKVTRPYLKLVEFNDELYAVPLRSDHNKYNPSLQLKVTAAGRDGFLDFSKSFKVLNRNIFYENDKDLKINVKEEDISIYIEKTIELKEARKIKHPTNEFALLNAQRDLHLKAYLEMKGLPSDSKTKFLCLDKEHNDNVASMSYNPKNNTIHCFSCGATYNLINLVRHEYDVDYKNAVKIIDKMIKTNFQSIDIDNTIDLENSKPIISDKERIEVNKKIIDFSKNIEMSTYLQDRGISLETCKKLNIGYDPKYNQVVLPVLNENYIIKRNIDKYVTDKGVEVRYMYMRDRTIPSTMPMGFNGSDNIFITEGYIDTLSLIELGQTSMSLNGANNIQNAIDIFKVYSGSKFIIALDNDAAGVRATKRIVEIFTENNIEYSFLSIDEKFNDINENLIKDKSNLMLSINKSLGLNEIVSLDRNNIVKSNLDYKKTNHVNIFKDTIKEIEDGVFSSFSSPTKFSSTLDSMYQLPNYSLNNIMLLKMQIDNDPVKKNNPIFAKTFNEWKKEGVQINKGAKALKIIQPGTYKAFEGLDGSIKALKNANDKEKELINTNDIKVFEKKYYRISNSLFHFTDTNYDLKDVLNQNIVDNKIVDIKNEYGNILSNLESNGVLVLERNLGLISGKLCKTEANVKYIMINSNLSLEEKFTTLIHEVTHLELNHLGSNIDLSTAEIEAESVAYLISKDVGLDTSEFSFKYLSSYTNEKDINKLTKVLSNIKEKYETVGNKYIKKSQEIEKSHEKNIRVSANAAVENTNNINTSLSGMEMEM